MRLAELDIGHPVNLTDHEKIILARITAAPDTNMDGFKKIPLNDPKLVTAVDLLINLGFIERDPNTDRIRVTDSGLDEMREDGLVDENNQLSDYGTKLAFGPTASGAPTTIAPSPTTATPSNLSLGSGGQGSAASPAPSPSGMNLPFQNESENVTFKEFLKLFGS